MTTTRAALTDGDIRLLLKSAEPEERALAAHRLCRHIDRPNLTEAERVEAQEILRLREILYGVISKHTGAPVEKIQRDCDRNLWLSPTEALEYGLVDKILERQLEMPKRPPTPGE